MNSLLHSPTVKRYLSSLLVTTALIGILVRLSPRTSKIGASHIIDVLLGVCMGLGLRLSALRKASSETDAEDSGEPQTPGSE
jgi:cyanate permease